jgi:hypothetical protein
MPSAQALPDFTGREKRINPLPLIDWRKWLGPYAVVKTRCHYVSATVDLNPWRNSCQLETSWASLVIYIGGLRSLCLGGTVEPLTRSTVVDITVEVAPNSKRITLPTLSREVNVFPPSRWSRRTLILTNHSPKDDDKHQDLKFKVHDVAWRILPGLSFLNESSTTLISHEDEIAPYRGPRPPAGQTHTYTRPFKLCSCTFSRPEASLS